MWLGGPVRFEVEDIEMERERLRDALEAEISEIERVESLAAWCNFPDPFGNRLGLFQDLSRPVLCAFGAGVLAGESLPTQVREVGMTNHNVHNDACLRKNGEDVDEQVTFVSRGTGYISACPDPDDATLTGGTNGPKTASTEDRDGDGSPMSVTRAATS